MRNFAPCDSHPNAGDARIQGHPFEQLSFRLVAQTQHGQGHAEIVDRIRIARCQQDLSTKGRDRCDDRAAFMGGTREPGPALRVPWIKAGGRAESRYRFNILTQPAQQNSPVGMNQGDLRPASRDLCECGQGVFGPALSG